MVFCLNTHNTYLHVTNLSTGDLYMHETHAIQLANGVKMPLLGLGVFKANGPDTQQAVKWALEAGYRSIDTAAIYGNETEVGNALKECKVPREHLFITTKVWNTDQGYDTTIKAFEKSLKKLQLTYLDLYLIHWPVQDKYVDTWRALEMLYNEGKIKAIGVCNFQPHHLDTLIQASKIVPMVNQIELHPFLSQEEVRNYCKQHNIVVEAWSPLGRGKMLDNPQLKEIADRHKKSIAQIILRWDIQNDIVTIPKSVKQNRIIENADIFDFSLSPEEIKAINALNKNERIGEDPDHFKF